MNKQLRKAAALLAAIGLTGAFLCGSAAAEGTVETTVKTLSNGAAGWLSENLPLYAEDLLPDQQLDWSAFALARGGYDGYPAYLEHADAVVRHNFDVTQPGADTSPLYLADFARIALAVDANGGDARNVGGHDLIEAVVQQYAQSNATNALAYSLLALNAKDYGEAEAADALVEKFVSGQLSDGSFSYLIPATSTPEGDPYYYLDLDSTAAVVQALAPYTDRAEVKAVIDKALACLQANQNADGTFGYGDQCATGAQVIVALCALGIDPLGEDYQKDGHTVFEIFEKNVGPNGGIMAMQYDPTTWEPTAMAENALTTFQSLYAFDAYLRFANGENALYDLRDAVKQEPTTEETTQSTTADVQTTAPAASTTSRDATTDETQQKNPGTGDRFAAVSTAAVLAGAALLVLRGKRLVK